MNAGTAVFLEELKHDPTVESVILFGSHARGDAREDSDVDLIVVCDKTKRGIEERGGQRFELVYVTEEDAKKYYRENKDNAVRTWKVAQVLFDRNGAAERLRECVAEIEKTGKHECSGDALNHLRFDVEDSLRAIRAISSQQPTEANYMLNVKLSHVLELFFDIRGMWKPAPKQLLGAVRRENGEIYDLVTDFYTEHTLEGKIAIFDSIVQKVFG